MSSHSARFDGEEGDASLQNEAPTRGLPLYPEGLPHFRELVKDLLLGRADVATKEGLPLSVPTLLIRPCVDTVGLKSMLRLREWNFEILNIQSLCFELGFELLRQEVVALDRTGFRRPAFPSRTARAGADAAVVCPDRERPADATAATTDRETL